MFTVSYPVPARGTRASERHETRPAAERAADEARAALVACGYGAHVDGVAVIEDEAREVETYRRDPYADGPHDGARVRCWVGWTPAAVERAASAALGAPAVVLRRTDGWAYCARAVA